MKSFRLGISLIILLTGCSGKSERLFQNEDVSYVSQAEEINISYDSKSDFTYAQWVDKITNNIDNKIPLYYDGFGSSGGHAFNLDGYQGSDHFHFNWGWGGAYNGYYYFTLEELQEFLGDLEFKLRFTTYTYVYALKDLQKCIISKSYNYNTVSPREIFNPFIQIINTHLIKDSKEIKWK